MRCQQIIRYVILFSLTLLASSTVVAQTYPTFTSGGQTPDKVAEGYSPSLTPFNGKVYMAFSDRDTGNLSIATSTDGLTFTGPTSVGVNIGISNSPTITSTATTLFMAYTVSEITYVMKSTDGTHWSSPTVVELDGNASDGRPMIRSLGNYIYLSYLTECDKLPGYCPIIGASTDGLHYSDIQYVNEVQDGVPAVSDPTMVFYNNLVEVIFLINPNQMSPTRQPNIIGFYPEGSSEGFRWAGSTGAGSIQIANDPDARVLNGGIIIFGQSIFQAEDNLWAIGFTDTNGFETAHEYGQVVGGGPGVTGFNSVFVEAARSKYNDNIWVYRAPN